MIRKNFARLSSFFWGTVFLQAQSQVREMTLEDAVNYALSESMDIKNAQISIADAEQTDL